MLKISGCRPASPVLRAATIHGRRIEGHIGLRFGGDDCDDHDFMIVIRRLAAA